MADSSSPDLELRAKTQGLESRFCGKHVRNNYVRSIFHPDEDPFGERKSS